MIRHSSYLRVLYAHTDQMGYAYHGRFVEYVEHARTELVRAMGLPYAEVERRGILMPVAEVNIRFMRPAVYDDLLRLDSYLDERPRSTFCIQTDIYNEAGTHLAHAAVRLAFVNAQTKRPVRCPDFIAQAVEACWGQMA